MTETEAYDHAQTIFGTEAGVWRVTSDPRVWSDGTATRCMVGRWVPLSELGDSVINGLTIEGPQIVLRSKRNGMFTRGLHVLGEGKTWADAFLDAEAKGRIVHEQTKPSA